MPLISEDFHGLAGETTFTDHPQSELTFSGTAGRKKRPYMALSQHDDLQVQSRAGSFAEASTTRCPLATIEPPELMSSLYSPNVEIDPFFRFQTQQLQSGIELLRRKHNRELFSMVEKQVANRIRVKEIELERVSKRNMELEQQLRKMAAECQAWFNYAKASEAVVSSLREKLDDVLTNQIACPSIDVGEGYGDSAVDPFPSTGNAEEESATDNHILRACMVCRDREVCVLLIPCRHLSVYKGCDSRVGTCPVCNSTINASIQVVVP